MKFNSYRIQFRTICVLFFVFITSSDFVFGQKILDKIVIISPVTLSVGHIFQQLEQKSGLNFIYNPKDKEITKTITLDPSQTSIENIFAQISNQTTLRLTLSGNDVAVRSVGRGTIKGTVQTSDEKPGEFVNVQVKETGKGTQTNEKGEFLIKNIPAGRHVLIVQLMGYAAIEREIDIAENQVATLLPVFLNEDSKTLQEVVINGTSNKFADKESDYVARLPLKNLENPQVYSVVGKDLMNQQMVVTLEESFRNVAGSTPTKTGAGMPAFISRGFQSGDNLRNGMATFLKTGIDPSIVEKVEVIKGPSSTLFGSAMVSFNGLVNYVTKKPYEKFGGEIAYWQGNYDLSRLTVDVNTPVNKEKTILFRLSGAVHKENSFQDQGFTHTFAVAPSLTYKASNRLTFTLNADLQTAKATSATLLTIGSGVKAKSFDELKLGYKRSLIDNSALSIQASNNVYFQADYKLSKNWKSQTNYAWSLGTYDQFNQFTYTWLTDSTIQRRVSVWLPDKWGRKQVQQNFIGDFNIGPVRNRLLIGVDFLAQYRQSHYAIVALDTANINKPNKTISLQRIQELYAKANAPEAITTQNTYSAYVSDMINFTDRLMVMLSLRADRFVNKGTYNNLTGLTTGDFSQTAFSPKLGVVYQPVYEKVSLFANYMNGFKNVGNVVQPDGTNSNFKPQQANQWEVGFKLDVIESKLNATFSYYDIAVSNSTRPEVVNNQTFTVQDGTQKSKGFEIEIIANPFSGLNIVAGYGNNENEFTKAAESVKGKSAIATPKHTGNIWVSYQLMQGRVRGIGAGIGGNYVSDSYFNSANTFTIPSYTLLDATLFYDQSKYRISVKANNLLNEKYWLSDGRPQKPANFIAGVTFKF